MAIAEGREDRDAFGRMEHLGARSKNATSQATAAGGAGAPQLLAVSAGPETQRKEAIKVGRFAKASSLRRAGSKGRESRVTVSEGEGDASKSRSVNRARPRPLKEVEVQTEWIAGSALEPESPRRPVKGSAEATGWFDHNYNFGAEHAIRMLKYLKEDDQEVVKPPGELLAVMDANQTIKVACFLIEMCTKLESGNPLGVFLAGFTFDLDPIVDKMIECFQRQGNVAVLLDKVHACGRTCKEEHQAVSRLIGAGITCYLSDGVDLHTGYMEAGRDIMRGMMGKMHSKFLVAGPYLVIGSTNWTSSSKGNHETSVLIYLNVEGWRAMRDRCERLKQGASHTLKGYGGVEEFGRLVQAAQAKSRARGSTSTNTPAPPGAGVGSLPAEDRWTKYIKDDPPDASQSRVGKKAARGSLQGVTAG